MIGRAEHVNEVTRSGTYHIQVARSKTWWIRSHANLYCGDELPEFSTIPGAEESETTKSWRLKIEVQEGDVLVWTRYGITTRNFRQPDDQSALHKTFTSLLLAQRMSKTVMSCLLKTIFRKKSPEPMNQIVR
jgi:hypothetical protein